MLWVARVVLAVASVLTVLFDPRVFFGGGQGGGGFISFASWFHTGSWWAVRLAIAALALYGIAALTSEGASRVGWRGPALALVLVGWALMRGVPHRDNVSSWSRGEVGAIAWFRADRNSRATARTPISADAFAGTWRSSDGTEWRFTPNEATRVVPAAAAESPAAVRQRCSGTFRAGYEERGRDVFIEQGIDSSAHASAVVRTFANGARFPVASVGCSDEPWSADLVRVSDDELWLFEPWMTAAEMRADAFVFRRVREPAAGQR